MTISGRWREHPENHTKMERRQKAPLDNIYAKSKIMKKIKHMQTTYYYKVTWWIVSWRS